MPSYTELLLLCLVKGSVSVIFVEECTPLQFSHVDGSLASSCKHDKNKTCHQRVDELLMSQWAAYNLEFGKPQCQTSSRYSGGKGQSSNQPLISGHSHDYLSGKIKGEQAS